MCDDVCRRRSAWNLRMSHNAPEFRNRWKADAPASRIVKSSEDSGSGTFVFRCAFPMRKDEKIGVERDHPFRSIHSCIFSRLVKSRSRGNPPFTVIRRTRFLCAFGCGSRSTNRNPSSTRARNGRRCSAAAFFACIKSSSGSSSVVFIDPYYHIDGLARAPGILPGVNTGTRSSKAILACTEAPTIRSISIGLPSIL